MENKHGGGKRVRKIARKARKARRLAQLPATKVAVTFRHVEPTQAISLYARRKFGHMSRFLKRSCDVHLILSVDKYRHRGEVIVKSGRLTVAAQEETKDLYSVIDFLADKVDRQLKRHLEKINARKTRTLSTGEVLSAAEERSVGQA